jgi:hypothetical protein
MSILASWLIWREFEKGASTLEEIFTETLSHYLDRIDPARKTARVSSSKSDESSVQSAHPDPISKEASSTSTTSTEPKQSTNTSEENAPSRYVPVALRKALQERSGGRCEYVSPQTGRRCESRFQLQVEHKIPFSCGGPTTLENCAYFCFTP